MISLGLRQAVSIKQKIGLKIAFRQSFGETIGDIPVYSLHRIKSMMARSPIGISEDLKKVLIEALSAANVEYKLDSGNDWSCLTSNNLVDAIEAVDSALKEMIEGINLPEEQAQFRERLQEELSLVREQGILSIKQWFEAHYDQLLYDMSGSVPWAVVHRLRLNLGYWIATKGNRFGDDIEDVILDIAKESNIVTDDPEVAWKKMGGKVFRSNS